MATIRVQICDALMAALAGVAEVGAVLDAASADDSTIARIVAGDPSAAPPVPGKHACELVFGDDYNPGDVYEVISKESWHFDVVVLTHLKNDLGSVRPYQAAQTLHAAVCVAAAVDPSWGGLATDTTPTGGGGVAIDEALGTRVVYSGFTVKYRHAVGNPEQG